MAQYLAFRVAFQLVWPHGRSLVVPATRLFTFAIDHLQADGDRGPDASDYDDFLVLEGPPQ